MRERVRTWLIDARLGLIERAELEARADRAIRALDDPPDYLTALSLGEPLLHVPRLDLVKEPLAPDDLARLAARLLEGLETGGLDLDRVAAVAARISFPRDDAMIGPWARFAWITDELDLIESGGKDGAGYRDRVIAVLREIAGTAAR